MSVHEYVLVSDVAGGRMGGVFMGVSMSAVYRTLT